ncbi:uncharacterized protein LOC101472163 isoform X2 [Maylandia zebra]|uniref:uncharacterized protein LOC101472163 isoform X2 n=1 Tax=Maylandia zebra TaxID=106582 RepID=UPI00403C1D42
MTEFLSTKATDKLNSQLNRLCVWLSSDPEYILAHCGDILSVNEYKKVIKQSSGSEQMRELLEIIIQKGEDTCQNFIDTLRKHQGHFPQLKQFFVTEAEVPGSSTPSMFADGSSVVSCREITNTTAKNISINIQTVSQPADSSLSGNIKPQADLTASGGGVICADKISGVHVDECINFSVSVNAPQENTEDTQPPPEGPAVRKIKEHKVELINCLMGDVFILQCVHAKGILSPRQYGNLKHSSNPEQTVTNLIDLLMSKGEETSDQFLQILKDPEVDATYPQLKNIIK